ncbi:hypothetical protein ACFZAC_14520 [Pseudomonas fluorescens]|uniref:hypothetical protein n=1 Tax=Pseudomonas fluorescens TaxID=294 RepID=UPI00374978B6
MDVHDTHVAVGAEFSRIFDPNDFLAMINIPDEALCILRGHLMLEEFLNLWSAKVTGTEDLFSGSFVSFKTKLVISKNLGMPEDLYVVIDKVNDIRNRFSHRKGHVLENSAIETLKKKVDDAIPAAPIQNCEEFEVHAEGKDPHGNPARITHAWKSSNNRIKFLILFVIFMLKFTHWIQEAFTSRGIPFDLIAIPKDGVV